MSNFEEYRAFKMVKESQNLMTKTASFFTLVKLMTRVFWSLSTLFMSKEAYKRTVMKGSLQ